MWTPCGNRGRDHRLADKKTADDSKEVKLSKGESGEEMGHPPEPTDLLRSAAPRPISWPRYLPTTTTVPSSLPRMNGSNVLAIRLSVPQNLCTITKFFRYRAGQRLPAAAPSCLQDTFAPGSP